MLSEGPLAAAREVAKGLRNCKVPPRVLRRVLVLLGAVSSCGMGAARREREVAFAVLDVSARRGLDDASADGSPARPFATLAAALRTAPPGALVRLDEGDYQAGLVLTRPVVLAGRGPARTRLLPGPGGGPVLLVRGTGRVALRGLAIEGGGIGLLIDGGEGHVLSDVALRGQGRAALLSSAAEVTLRGSEIIDAGGGTSGVGIEAIGGSIHLEDCLLRRAGRRALAFRGARAQLDAVDIAGSALAAVRATDGATVRIRGGSFAHQGGDALYASGARLSVDGAHLADNEYGVLGFRGAHVSVEGSLLEDHRVAAVAVVGASGSIKRSTIYRGGIEGGISAQSTSEPLLVEDSRIIEPGTFGIHLSNGSAIIRGSEIAFATTDRQHELGDGIYAADSSLILQGTVLRSNQGSGLSLLRSQLTLESSDFVGNGRAGVSLLDHTTATAAASLFGKNGAGIVVGERSELSLAGNVFDANALFAIDASCGELVVIRERGRRTQYLGPSPRQRACP
jgi:hypothetical protein